MWNRTWNTMWNIMLNTMWNTMWNTIWNTMWNTMWNTIWNTMWNISMKYNVDALLKCSAEMLVVNTDNIPILKSDLLNTSHLRNSIRTIHYQITLWNTVSKQLRKHYWLWNKQRNATENSNCTFATWLSTGGLTFEISPRICACECHILFVHYSKITVDEQKVGWSQETPGGSTCNKPKQN